MMKALGQWQYPETENKGTRKPVSFYLGRRRGCRRHEAVSWVMRDGPLNSGPDMALKQLTSQATKMAVMVRAALRVSRNKSMVVDDS